jgi:hypothetical protein
MLGGKCREGVAYWSAEAWNTRALSAPRTPSEPEALLQKGPNGEKELELWRYGAGCLTDADKAAGWTEVPLYAHPAPKPVASDLEQHLREDVARLEQAGMYFEDVALAAEARIATLTARVAELGKERDALHHALYNRDAAFAKGRDAGLEEASYKAHCAIVDVGFLPGVKAPCDYSEAVTKAIRAKVSYKSAVR